MGSAFAVCLFWVRLWQHQDPRAWRPWAFLFLRFTVVLVLGSSGCTSTTPVRAQYRAGLHLDGRGIP